MCRASGSRAGGCPAPSEDVGVRRVGGRHTAVHRDAEEIADTSDEAVSDRARRLREGDRRGETGWRFAYPELARADDTQWAEAGASAGAQPGCLHEEGQVGGRDPGPVAWLGGEHANAGIGVHEWRDIAGQREGGAVVCEGELLGERPDDIAGDGVAECRWPRGGVEEACRAQLSGRGSAGSGRRPSGRAARPGRWRWQGW